jgi:hypothetical protein
MHLIRAGLILLSAIVASAAMAANSTVDAPFRGTWVPVKAACTSPVKLVIEANKVTFINGAQRAVYPKLDQCYTCMGKDVSNIVWLSTDAMGDSPFIIHLNTTKQAVYLDTSNDKKLASRFPLGTGPFKKCD